MHHKAFTSGMSRTKSVSVGGEMIRFLPCHGFAGPELRRLLFTKFGKTYDLSFIRRDIPGKVGCER